MIICSLQIHSQINDCTNKKTMISCSYCSKTEKGYISSVSILIGKIAWRLVCLSRAFCRQQSDKKLRLNDRLYFYNGDRNENTQNFFFLLRRIIFNCSVGYNHSRENHIMLKMYQNVKKNCVNNIKHYVGWLIWITSQKIYALRGRIIYDGDCSGFIAKERSGKLSCIWIVVRWIERENTWNRRHFNHQIFTPTPTIKYLAQDKFNVHCPPLHSEYLVENDLFFEDEEQQSNYELCTNIILT